MNIRASLVATGVLMATVVAALESGAQEPPDREISVIKGDLYRLRSGTQHTVFLVTPGGIVLADPIGLATAQWLNPELERRFPPGLVRYVLYTSHRVERAEGGVIFNDRAELVGHRKFNQALSRSRQREETRYRRVQDAETHFDATRAITIGGSTIEVVHAPTDVEPEGAVVNFRRERVAFAGDAPLLDQSPFTFGPFKPRTVRRWLATLAAMDFDVLLLGNGRSMPKGEIVRLSAYVDGLVERVASEYEAGRSASEFPPAALPPGYQTDAAFRDWRANVSDTYRDVSVFTVETTIGAMGHYAVKDNTFCASFTTCSTGGLVPGGMANLSVSFGRWSVLGELTAIEEVFSARTSRFYDEDFALRETRAGVMIRRNMPAGAAALRVMGGMFYGIGDRRGLDRVKEGLAPFAGRHPIESRDTRYGVTGGVDIVVGRRLGIVLPLRFNYAFDDATTAWPSRMDVQAGVGITLRLYRTID